MLQLLDKTHATTGWVTTAGSKGRLQVQVAGGAHYDIDSSVGTPDDSFEPCKLAQDSSVNGTFDVSCFTSVRVTLLSGERARVAL